MRLIFVRHGEPDYKNDCLTENGIEQAVSTAERLKKEPIAAVYASPMGRAVETASYTAKGHGLEVRTLDFMHEINWGTLPSAEPGIQNEELGYNGHPWTLAYEMLTENPELVGSRGWIEHPYFKNNICTGYFGRISDELDVFLSGYGLERRDGVYYCRKACDDTIALFAHGGSGACAISHIFSLPLPFVLTSLPYGVCSVTIIAFDSHEGKKIIPRFELFNDVGHISRLKPEMLKFEK